MQKCVYVNCRSEIHGMNQVSEFASNLDSFLKEQLPSITDANVIIYKESDFEFMKSMKAMEVRKQYFLEVYHGLFFVGRFEPHNADNRDGFICNS